MVSRLSGGHNSSVLCVDVSPLTLMVASGSENGELCLWSSAGELIHRYARPDTECTSVLFSRHKANILYAAFGKEVLIIDTAQLDCPPFTFRTNQDDISQLALDDKEDFLAACDDGGEIKVYGLRDRKVFKTLRFKHTNICSSVVFRGKQRPWELMSGGLDCRLVHWNFSRPESLNQFNMQELHSTTSDVTGYLLNPPFIHHLARNREGTLMAAALENGLVAVFNSSSKHVKEKLCLHAHHQAASQVYFTTDTILVTTGNDARIVVWDISKAEPHLGQGNVATNGNGCSADHDNDCHNEIITEACRISVLEHGSKVNWLAPFLQDDKWFVVIADNSTDLTIYPLNLTG